MLELLAVEPETYVQLPPGDLADAADGGTGASDRECAVVAQFRGLALRGDQAYRLHVIKILDLHLAQRPVVHANIVHGAFQVIPHALRVADVERGVRGRVVGHVRGSHGHAIDIQGRQRRVGLPRHRQQVPGAGREGAADVGAGRQQEAVEIEVDAVVGAAAFEAQCCRRGFRLRIHGSERSWGSWISATLKSTQAEIVKPLVSIAVLVGTVTYPLEPLSISPPAT